MAITPNGSRQTNELVGSNYNNGFIGGETLLLRRDIYRAIHDRYREGEGLADVLIGLGKKVKTANTTFNWFEDDYLINTMTIGLQAAAAGESALPFAGGAGASAIINVAQDADGNTPFLVGDLVMVTSSTGRIRCLITAKTVDAGANTDQFTLKPVDSTDNLNGIDEGDVIYYFSSAFADGTGQPGSSVRKPLSFNNVTQIIKTQFKSDGSEAANEVEVMIGGKPYYYRHGVEDALKKHMMQVEYALILGKKSASLPDAAGNTVNTTQGLEEAIDERGNTQTYTSYSYADMEDMIRTLDTERAPEVYMGLIGTELLLDLESALHARGVGINGAVQGAVTAATSIGGTGIDFSMFGRGGSARAYDFGFDSYRLGGRTFHIKKWDSLNYAPITGYTASPYPSMGFFMPMITFKDAKTHQMLDSVCLRYKQNDLENRFMKEWTRDRNVTNEDSFEWNHQTEMGLQLALVNQYIKVTV